MHLPSATAIAAAVKEIKELETKAAVFGPLPERPDFQALIQGIGGLKRAQAAREEYAGKLRTIVESKVSAANGTPMPYTQITSADAHEQEVRAKIAERERMLNERGIPFKPMAATGTASKIHMMEGHASYLLDLFVSKQQPQAPKAAAVSNPASLLQRYAAAAVPMAAVVSDVAQLNTEISKTLRASTMSRADFVNLTPAKKSAYCLAGGRLSDDAAPVSKDVLAALTILCPDQQTITYAEFSKLDAGQKMDFCTKGGKITD